MAEPDPPPTLASLRRAQSRRSKPVSPGPATERSLFDLFAEPPAEEPEPPASSFTNIAAEAVGPETLSRSEPKVVAAAQAAAASFVAEDSLPPSPSSGVAVPLQKTGVSPRQPSVAEPEPDPEIVTRKQAWTVSSLVSHVRGLVERGYGRVTVEGEISNWRPAASGHCYFTLKDADAQISAVLFRRQASLLRFRPSDGDAVRVHGQLTVYESRGQMQVVVEWMEQAGLGALLAAVQRLKEALRREGLFDRKRPLPPFPRCIGVVTSLQGAALRDIVKVCRRRHAGVRLLIYPAAVQGPNCAAEVAAGLRWFNAHPERAEVVLVARGGGSWEDLHGFDDERVARAIAGCVLPVITGIGHATDSTIADAAADVCAPTPSAAAELLTAGQHRVEERVTQLQARVLRAGRFQLLQAQGRLARLSAGGVLRRVEDGLNRRAQRLDELGFRAEAAMRGGVRRREAQVQAVSARLNRQSPSLRFSNARQELSRLHEQFLRASQRRRAAEAARVETCSTRLQAMNPLRVLERGYALVYGADGHLLRAANAAFAGDEIRARLAHGELRARVLRPADRDFAPPERDV